LIDKLPQPAARALNVSASSSPVERVFSQRGIILKPHGHTLLSKLIVLKCNNRANIQCASFKRLSIMIHSDFKSSALLTSTFAVLSINTTWISSRGTHTGS